MAARKKPASNKVQKVQVVDDNYTPLEQYCIALNEYWKALKTAGFPESICMTLIMDRDSYPDWILPKPINPTDIPLFDPYEDEDED
jgi:hypothetical protein